jgi:signal peptidase I
VKRIIGLPDDHMQLWDGTIVINGTAVERQTLRSAVVDKATFNFHEEVMPDGHRCRVKLRWPMEPEETMPEVIVPRSYYYVLGDNRDNSLDSRYSGFGFVKRDDLVGRPRLVLLSHSPRRIISSHDYPVAFLRIRR